MNIYIITSETFNHISKSDKTQLEEIRQIYENSNIIFEYYISNAWLMPIFYLTITATDENNFTIYTYDGEERTHTIKKEKIISIIELIKQYKDIFSSENCYIESENNVLYLDAHNYTIVLSDTENLYYFLCEDIGFHAPNVKHLTELINSITKELNINDKYKSFMI